MAKKSEFELLSEVRVKIYKPIDSEPLTHKPVITFSGDILSMKQVSMIEFYMRKELRKYKLNQGANLKRTEERSDDRTE
jgi:hypothetical protein